MGKFGIKDQIRDFGDMTTIHGIKDFITAKSKVMMVVWSVVMLAAFGACCWQLQQTITSYMSKPTAISTSIYELPELPLFNFHVPHVINIPKLMAFGLNCSHMAEIYASFPLMPLLNFNQRDHNSKLLDDIEEVQAKHGLQDFQEFIKSIARDPFMVSVDGRTSESFVVAAMTGMMVNVSVEVNELGPFYQAAMSTSNIVSIDDSQRREEPPNGYQTWLSVSPTPVLGYTDFPELSPIYEQSYGDCYNQMTRGNIKSATSFYVSVGQGSRNILEWFHVDGYSQLLIETQMMKTIKGCNDHFESEAECRNQCLLDAIPKPQEECEWFWRKANSSMLCKGWIDMTLVSDADRNRCRSGKQCQPTCTKYTHTISRTYSQSVGGRIWVNVIVKALQVMMLEEYASYSAVSLFGNVGGILSLYLGASIVSLLQLVYFCAFHRRGAVQPAT